MMMANSNFKTFSTNVPNQAATVAADCEKALSLFHHLYGWCREFPGSLLESSLSVEHQLSALTGSTECFLELSAALRDTVLSL